MKVAGLDKLQALRLLESEIAAIEGSRVGHPLVRLQQMISTWDADPHEVVQVFLERYGSSLPN